MHCLLSFLYHMSFVLYFAVLVFSLVVIEIESLSPFKVIIIVTLRQASSSCQVAQIGLSAILLPQPTVYVNKSKLISLFFKL